MHAITSMHRRWRRRAVTLWHLFAPVRRPFAWFLAVVMLATMLEAAALATLVPLLDGPDSTSLIASALRTAFQTVGLPLTHAGIAVAVAILFVLRSAVQYNAALLAAVMQRRQAVSMQLRLFEGYMRMRWEHAATMSQGTVQHVLLGQSGQAAQFIKTLAQLIESSVYTVGLTIAALLVSARYTVLSICLVGGSATIVAFVSARVRAVSQRVMRTVKAESGVLLQYTRGARTLRAYGVEAAAVEHVRDMATSREQLTVQISRLQAVGTITPDLLFVVALLALIGSALTGGESIASVGTVAAILLRIAQYAKRFSSMSKLSDLIPVLGDLDSHLRRFDRHAVPHTDGRADASLSTGTIVLDDVSYTYPHAGRRALTDISGRVEPGEFIGVVGRSGGGKSTLIQLIAGLLHPQQGSVRIGVPEARPVTRTLSYVSQEPFLLAGTLRDNVDWFRGLSNEEILSACHRAGLEALLTRLPAGLDTPVAQEGLTISGGERQRISLARALADDPDILVLDEATSALDSDSERIVLDTVERLRGDVTIVWIAHRLSTVIDADRVWVMDGGAIIEQGPPAELLSCAGTFRDLSVLQGLSLESI